ncbi:sigma-54-dependent transcriptional regulator [candidate division KSB1 bacterium]
MQKRILIVDDDEKFRSLIEEILQENGFDTVSAKNGYEALEKIKQNSLNLILLDINMPGINGLDVFRESLKIKPEIPVVIISGHGTIPLAIEATKMGAYDFIEKPVSEERLTITVKNALEKEELVKDRSHLIEEMNKTYKITGNSEAIKRVFNLIEKAAGSDSKVLITGENGTGKELVANAIHFKSARANKPFVKVNCAALPENLIESELFGHVKGAFTGALTDRTGRFEYADGGTIFLDEIGDLSRNIQVKLLRVIQDGEIEKIGSNVTRKVDVRLITATNTDILKEVETGNFREDLFYRINVINIDIAPLRERKEDIPLMIDHFQDLNVRKSGIPKKVLTDKAVALLKTREWKGNVRELENFIEKMMIMIDDIYVSDKEISNLLNINELEETEVSIELRSARSKFEKDHILSLLNLNNWNISRTAKKLGITRALLYRKLDLLNIKKVSHE